jgi:hypothetical protein
MRAAEFSFCANSGCLVVFFSSAGDRFMVGDVASLVFQKSSDDGRLVCYCFEHSVREVEADAVLHSSSTIAAQIRENCRAGRDDCRVENPQGACCLGNVMAVVRHALELTDSEDAGCARCDPEHES